MKRYKYYHSESKCVGIFQEKYFKVIWILLMYHHPGSGRIIYPESDNEILINVHDTDVQLAPYLAKFYSVSSEEHVYMGEKFKCISNSSMFMKMYSIYK
jgi:hypothetical protein